MLGIVFSIDICTRHRMSYKNVDLNFCAHTWHSVSVLGHNQGFELAVPVFKVYSTAVLLYYLLEHIYEALYIYIYIYIKNH